MEHGIKRNWGVVLAISLLLLSSVFMNMPAAGLQDHAFAATIDLPETGQTICYDTNSFVISCANTGQDGDIKAGVTWPISRFTDNNNGTVKDNLTGRIWLKNANCFGTLTWADALTAIDGLGNMVCGLTDGSTVGHWRLPNANELESLINAGQANTATWLNEQGFSNVQANWYWSSTTSALNTDNAWNFNMWNGNVNNDNKTNSRYVWPVRAYTTTAPAQLWKTGQTIIHADWDDGNWQRGIAWPAPRFTVGTGAGADCVTDNLTGLMWVKSPDSDMRSWQRALDHANGLSLCGYSDWRLPNRKELRSLINYGQANTATWLNNEQGFSNVRSDWYWSSTTYANAKGDAWFVSMWNGYVFHVGKPYSYYVWPVRAGSGIFYDLIISKAGTGTGTVTSNPVSINCGADCSESYASGTGVTLTANADTGSTFAGWSGDCNSDGQVTMDTNKTCTATFNLIRTLTVTKSGTGTGAVTAGANCTLNWVGSTGTCTVNDGTAITLSGSADASSTFGGWSGGTGSASACSGTGACSFNITADSGVTATFTINTYTVTANATGNGTGTVASDAGGINYTYQTTNTGTTTALNHGTSVTLTATAGVGSTVSWTTCTGTTGSTTAIATCTFSSLDANKTAQATFTLNQYTITASANPPAGGGVICSPNPVNHGSNSTCTITTNTGYTLQGVGGTCGGSLSANIYTTNAITGNCTVVATFIGVYSISGRVTTQASSVGILKPPVPLSGVTITLSGASAGTTVTDANGNYSFSGLVSGNYTVTPSSAGYAFTPLNRSANINNTDITNQNFTGRAVSATFSISGTVRTSGGAPIEGVTMTLTGAAMGTTTTDASGNYSFSGLVNGGYTVTPSLAGYTFAPSNRSARINNANVTAQDFTGAVAPSGYSISGTVRNRVLGVGAGSSVSGVTITLSGTAGGTTTTDGSGNYSFTGLSGGNYTVTPSQTGRTFTPASRAVTVIDTNMTGQNFIRN